MDSVSHPSSSSSTTDRQSYDVFLSFRGKDTRKTFTGHLFTALEQAGVDTFRDEDELERGEKINESLFEAIKKSRISIPVFSKKYASSKWCLEELATMVKCKKDIDQKILPIFLDVTPSDVRNQTGSVGAAFRQLKHRKRFEDDKALLFLFFLFLLFLFFYFFYFFYFYLFIFYVFLVSEDDKVKRWKGALRETGQLKGWDLAEVADRDQSVLISMVVKDVLRKLSNISFDVAEYPVGIESRVEDMMGYLQLESDNVLFVGIWGLGGLGKTTIAKAVLNKISCNFEVECFLQDIREVTSTHGLVTLQRKLLQTLHKTYDDIPIDGQGKTVIKKRLHTKKVLLVLDNVDDSKQLEALAGESNWFGSGSRIIVTTRNKRTLEQHQVGLIYEPKELDSDQSLQLFSKHAFRKDQPSVDLMKLSKEAVKIAGGIPMALKDLGSSLFFLDKKEWEDEVDKWKKNPSSDFHNILKLSYDELDVYGKQIFLDIACFFIGMDKELSITFWKGCEFYPNSTIKVLMHKCLVKIGYGNRLSMHDHIRDMGREIVRQEDYKQPGMRSRLWLHEEALDVIKEETGTSKIEGLQVGFIDSSSRYKLSFKSLALMSKLRLLWIDYVELEGELEHLLKDLRWLSWKRCPLKHMPTAFHLSKLVVLHLKRSYFTQFDCLPPNKRPLEKLKVLDLTDCVYLTSIYNLSELPCLEELNMPRCTLIERLPDLSNLKELTRLDLTNCRKLSKIELNDKIKSLKALFMGGCCNSLVDSLTNSLVPGPFECLSSLIFPGSEIPDWFTPVVLSHEGEGKVRLYCEVPPSKALLNPKQQWQEHEINIEGVMLCFVFANQVKDSIIDVGVDVKRNGNHVSSVECLFPLWVPKSNQEDHFYFCHRRDHRLLSVLHEGDEVSFKIMGLQVKKAGLHMVYK